MTTSAINFYTPTVTLRGENGIPISSQPLAASGGLLQLAIPRLFSPEQKAEAIEKGVPPMLILKGTSLSPMTTQQVLRIIKACPDHAPLGVRCRVNYLYREALEVRDEAACASLVRRGANGDMRRWKLDEVRSKQISAAIKNHDFDRAQAMVDELQQEKQQREALLIKAVKDSDMDGVCALLAEGVDPNLPNSDKCPLLILAVGKNNPAMLKALLDAGADPDKEDGSMFTAIYCAAEEGDATRFEMVKMLLEAGANPNYAMNWKGYTPLHEAANGGDVETVRILLEHGADPFQRTDNHDETPLEWVQARLTSSFLNPTPEEREALECVASILKEAMA